MFETYKGFANWATSSAANTLAKNLLGVNSSSTNEQLQAGYAKYLELATATGDAVSAVGAGDTYTNTVSLAIGTDGVLSLNTLGTSATLDTINLVYTVGSDGSNLQLTTASFANNDTTNDALGFAATA